MEEFVVLVNPEDKVLGLMEKQQAHINGYCIVLFLYFYSTAMAKCFFRKELRENIILSEMDQCSLFASKKWRNLS
jgi:isopentenyl-diphosphate delta-isomerase